MKRKLVNTNYIVKIGGEVYDTYATLKEARIWAKKCINANEVKKINEIVEIYREKVIEKRLKVIKPDLDSTGSFDQVFGGI